MKLWNKLTLKRRRDIISFYKQWWPLVALMVVILSISVGGEG